MSSSVIGSSVTTAPSSPSLQPIVDDQTESCAITTSNAAVIGQHISIECIKNGTVNDAHSFAANDEKRSSQGCLLVPVNFIVEVNDAALESLEMLGLTGDAPHLGYWQLSNSIAMIPDTTLNNTRWTVTVPLCDGVTISYRYFVYTMDGQGRKQIRRWEDHLNPRSIQTFGQAADGSWCTRLDQFGIIDGAKQIFRGWLTHEAIVQFKFDRANQLKFLSTDPANASLSDGLLVKIVPHQNTDRSMDGMETLNGTFVEVVKMIYNESKLQPQESFGIHYEPDDVIIFHVTVPFIEITSYTVILHTIDRKPIGRVRILPSELIGSNGVLELNVTTTTTSTIAQLTLPYLVIRPMPFAQQQFDFQTSFAHTWNSDWQGLDVGHRGLGRSFLPEPPSIIENTIASFMETYRNRGDAIELDVHMTSDNVPVVYHDFEVLTTVAKDVKAVPISEKHLTKVLINDVTYDQLKDLRVFAKIKNGEIREYPAHNAEPIVENRIFPTLIDVFKALPKSLGIDVEIKYPQSMASGVEESKRTCDMNLFADIVISITQRYGCGRALIFTSFDADFCTMLRFKQNKFPVAFLTQGKTTKWPPFMDRRTLSVVAAINHAQAFELIGIAPHADDIAQDPTLVSAALNLGQKVFIWGDLLNDTDRVEYFKRLNLTAVIYDRMDLYGPKEKRTNLFENKEFLQLFQTQC